MFELAAFTYGVLASFVLASFANNKRAERDNPRILTLFGYSLMAFSCTLSLLLAGFVVYQTVQGGPLILGN